MAIKDLLPARWRKNNDLEARNSNLVDSFTSLQREMNRVFDSFFDNWDFPKVSSSFSPTLDISENEKEYKISVELPGMEEKDIEVHSTEDSLTISGTKKNEMEEKKDHYHYFERSYGSFKRTIPLGENVDSSKISASFKKGVLHITVPKNKEYISKQKKIPILSE
ncbi:MAG TPA: Hsp20/alpha crystallin family protein [Leptospiraceae bacterium]|nr:Hsp20/alpha crystallin family protein [Leptospiraceae bacterium]HMX32628.1 Hsp20/alpha crystallin family protein [Leptospiraceae bacterium]HMY33342.1 Hsp20/alpha crystallin family protein [Leptospiraceae bacterium]HMZ66216.1 Hsp20/alpha crystallin family protein [Leptospiraceae bacterium]HNA07521.1 Hsp20/alpha crystallin family protein [Leptospiraceae bacterium]